MTADDFIAEPGRFRRGAGRWEKPAAVIDLDAGDEWPLDIALPPCPVIGFGSAQSKGAHLVDALVEPPFTIEALLGGVGAAPRAAAVAVQLLRVVSALCPEDALTLESFAYATVQGSEEHRQWLAARPPVPPGAPGSVRLARAGNELEVTLDRPASGNAIDRTMRDGLYEAFSLASCDPQVSRIELRGEGKAFSLGADLSEFGTTTDPATAFAIRAATLPARMAVVIADRLVARVQGACIGAGLEIAAFANRLEVTENAWFQLPELAMGILPGAGGCVSLTRRIGRQRVALLILSGKRLSARAALDWGLADAIVDDLA